MHMGGFFISQIKQIGDRVFDRILAQKNIDAFNGAQGRILFVLWQGDKISMKELSSKTGLATTTLTSMLDRMENSGLLKRTYDQSDRRKNIIVLTARAYRLQSDYENVSTDMSHIYYKGFTDNEISAFEEYLQRVLKNLKSEEGNLYGN
ncbi:MAG: MarR family transcriptional regulator [Lachnospiraceae bacterium]|nr:MarR family transcriptional regulator [Lachnospiraceae bacterium]